MLIDFHHNDTNVCLQIGLALQQQDLLNTKGRTPQATIYAYQSLINQYRHSHSSCLAEFYYRIATLLDTQYIKAVAYCDTVLTLYPDTYGAAQCSRLKYDITSKSLNIYMPKGVYPSNHNILAVTTCRNIDTLYYRIIPNYKEFPDYYDKKQLARHIRKLPSIKEWYQVVPHRDDYNYQKVFCYIPSLPVGKYSLIASDSPNIKDTFEVLYQKSLIICDALMISINQTDIRKEQSSYGYLMNRISGKPIPGQKVALRTQEKSTTDISHTTTDQNGFFALHTNHLDLSWFTYCLYQGQHIRIFNEEYSNSNDTTHKCITIFTDRPIYRPGDTLHFSGITYQSDAHYYAEVIANQKMPIRLISYNRSIIDSLTLFSDSMGQFNGRFIIPTNSVPGNYSLKIQGLPEHWNFENKNIRVEAYKSPKFMVSLSPDKHRYRCYDSIQIEGIAASYSDAPVSNALVTYTVTRQQLIPYWRRWHNFQHAETKISSGQTHTDAAGHFVIPFVAWPDTAANARTYPSFEFQIEVNVTDCNGETHTATKSLHIGSNTGYIDILTPSNVNQFSELQFQYRNSDGQPIADTLQLCVEQLHLSETAHLSHPVMGTGNAIHTISPKEFAERYPLIAYNASENNLDSLSVEREVLHTTLVTTLHDIDTFHLPPLPAGIYRVTLSSADTTVIKGRTHITFTPPNTQRPLSNELLWADVHKTPSEVGDTLTLRVGTRYQDVTVYGFTAISSGMLQHETKVLNNEIHTLRIPITDTMVGALYIKLLSIKEDIKSDIYIKINVPYTHKKLQMEFASFRNKLAPGNKETWTIHVNGTQYQPANCLLSMYDAALNFASLNWDLNLWGNPTDIKFCHSPLEDTDYWGSFCLSDISFRHLHPVHSPFSKSWLKSFPFMIPFSNTLGEMKAIARGESRMASVGYTNEDVEEYAISQPKKEIVNGCAALDVQNTTPTNNNATPIVNPRRNLSSLAFFRPNLQTDSTGNVSFSFTVPERLSSWSIHGLAWTHDLKIGSLIAQAITQKEVMVTPNVPRFLRHGDTIDFASKVSNLTDSVQHVTIHLEMFNGQQMANPTVNAHPIPIILGPDTKIIDIPAHSSKSVSFRLRVPQNLYVATYKITAYAAHHSDGEQADIPVLTNRQLVTESVSMYINGKDSKHYSLQHLTLNTSTTLQPQLLKVEFTSNPIWYAIQSLPYVASQENPSNIYRFNAYYTNSLALQLVEQVPTLKQTFQLWLADTSTITSPLFQNEEVKQTLLEETPWLYDAINETEQRKQIAHYFNTMELYTQLSDNLQKLITQQHSDGSWSWIPNVRYSSLYTTEYILKGFGRLKKFTQKDYPHYVQYHIKNALHYVDQENYSNYIKYIKQNPPIYEADNIDYLYIRSFYTDEPLKGKTQEMYNYYYRNAVKHYNEYHGLYSRAQLALVFQRGGDTLLARTIVKQLKESALYNDEMGMYWRDNTCGYFWYQRPVEVQAFLIEAFQEIVPSDSTSVALMQQWLLKQKQTTRWNSDIATVHAIYALLPKSSILSIPTSTKIDLFPKGIVLSSNNAVSTSPSNPQGYQSRTWDADSIVPAMGNVTIDKLTPGIAWGALYYQYVENIDKIPANEMGVRMQRKYYRVEPHGNLTLVENQTKLKVGEKVRVQILLSCDRNLEYLELKDTRAAAFEPVSSISGWQWNSGLSYYVAVNNANNTYYIEHLSKGKYVVEYDVWLNNSGTFTLAPATLQCLYAPEFRANTSGTQIRVLTQ